MNATTIGRRKIFVPYRTVLYTQHELLPKGFEELFSRVYKVYPSEYSFAEWRQRVEIKEAAFICQFHGNDLVYAAVLEVSETALNLVSGSGLDNQWCPVEFDQATDNIARIFGKKQKHLIGRKGWWRRHLKPLGYAIAAEEYCRDSITNRTSNVYVKYVQQDEDAG